MWSVSLLCAIKIKPQFIDNHIVLPPYYRLSQMWPKVLLIIIILKNIIIIIEYHQHQNIHNCIQKTVSHPEYWFVCVSHIFFRKRIFRKRIFRVCKKKLRRQKPVASGYCDFHQKFQQKNKYFFNKQFWASIFKDIHY